jgi:hypothetical protein
MGLNPGVTLVIFMIIVVTGTYMCYPLYIYIHKYMCVCVCVCVCVHV